MRFQKVVFAAVLMLGWMYVDAQQIETVLLVRHADRASNAPDSLLSDAGQQRADCLARTLADSEITQIYVTDVRRTQQTAEPLARILRIQPTVVPKSNMSQLLADLHSQAGKTVLVVGHADTIPGIVEQLGGGKIMTFGDTEYDRLIFVPLSGKNAGKTVTVRYCEQRTRSR